MISSILSLTLTLSSPNLSPCSNLTDTRQSQVEPFNFSSSNRSLNIQNIKTFTDIIEQDDKQPLFISQVENLFGDMHEMDDSFRKEVKAELNKNSRGTGIFLD